MSSGTTPTRRRRGRRGNAGRSMTSRTASPRPPGPIWWCSPRRSGGPSRSWRGLAGHVGPAAVVTDALSVKRPVVRAAGELLPHPGRFVGAHPMAGGESSGPAAGAGRPLRRGRLPAHADRRHRPGRRRRGRGVLGGAGLPGSSGSRPRPTTAPWRRSPTCPTSPPPPLARLPGDAALGFVGGRLPRHDPDRRRRRAALGRDPAGERRRGDGRAAGGGRGFARGRRPPRARPGGRVGPRRLARPRRRPPAGAGRRGRESTREKPRPRPFRGIAPLIPRLQVVGGVRTCDPEIHCVHPMASHPTGPPRSPRGASAPLYARGMSAKELDREAEAERMMAEYGGRLPELLPVVERNFAVLANRSQLLLVLAGVVVSTIGFSGRLVAGTNAWAQWLVVAGLTLTLLAAGAVSWGVLHLRWLTMQPGGDTPRLAAGEPRLPRPQDEDLPRQRPRAARRADVLRRGDGDHAAQPRGRRAAGPRTGQPPCVPADGHRSLSTHRPHSGRRQWQQRWPWNIRISWWS